MGVGGVGLGLEEGTITKVCKVSTSARTAVKSACRKVEKNVGVTIATNAKLSSSSSL